MHILLAALLLAAPPFWEATPPEQWTEEQLREIFHVSPWAAMLSLRTQVGGMPPVHVYLASARPMQEAEEEILRRRRLSPAPEHLEEDEYRLFIRENRGRYIVLAVGLPDPNALTDVKEARRMEEDCILRVGKKKFKMTGHFPPTPSDPYLRLLFPRDLGPDDKRLRFELYLPSVPAPYRRADFDLEDLVYKGKVEM